MSGQRRGPQQATLFELELDEVEEPTFAPEPPPLPAAAVAARPAAGRAMHAPLRARLFAGLADLAVHVAMVAVALLGARALGAPPTLAQAPAFAVLLLVLSLFYTVVPLAFWGKTPGMAAVGLVCEAGDELPLTFAEALRRWLGELVTVLALGLPGLLALGANRRSLADRWSGSDLVTE